MEKKNVVIVMFSVILALLVGGIGGYVLFASSSSNENENDNNLVDTDSNNDCQTIVKTISYEDTGKKIFGDYIKERGSINHQINSVDLVIGCSKEFILSINYDVEVVGNPYNSNFGAGNGELDGQWIRHKSQFVIFELENNEYKIRNTATGVGGSFQSCSDGKIVFGVE